MKSIVVLSGKGGVGKSSIIASLALILSKSHSLVCADCDVDTSNLSLLFNIPEEKYNEWKYLSTNQIAVVDKNKCINCNKCVKACYFDALKLSDGYPMVKEFGCEGCGACELVCPTKAISLKDINNAKIGFSKTKYGFLIASAQLMPGFSGSGKVVYEVRKKAKEISPNSEIMLIDASAGIGCPVIASVTGNDYALLVTEPTPSGFSDLKRALSVVDHFGMKKGLIINKYDINLKLSERISSFAKENNISLLAKIPFDKEFVKAMTAMVPVIDFNEGYRPMFNDIAGKIISTLFE